MSDDDGAGGGSASNGDRTSTTAEEDDGSDTGSTATASDSMSGAASTGRSASSTSTTGETGSTGTPPGSCVEQAAGECTQVDDCENVSGAEVWGDGSRGEYVCSDLGLPFACAAGSCMRFSGILCADDTGDMRWVVEQCVPEGWAPCPDATCVRIPPP